MNKLKGFLAEFGNLMTFIIIKGLETQCMGIISPHKKINLNERRG
jgi:hypothetical protein